MTSNPKLEQGVSHGARREDWCYREIALGGHLQVFVHFQVHTNIRAIFMGYTFVSKKNKELQHFDVNNHGAEVLRAAMQAAGVSWTDTWQIGDGGKVSRKLGLEMATKLEKFLAEYGGEPIGRYKMPQRSKVVSYLLGSPIKRALPVEELEHCHDFVAWLRKADAWGTW